MATANSPEGDEIDEIFRNAGEPPTVVDSQRAQGSDMMGDNARQDSRTTDSFSMVDEATAGGSVNSNMSPDENNPRSAAASSGQQPTDAAAQNATAGAKAKAPAPTPKQAPVGAMNAQAPTFAPVGTSPSP